MVLVCDEAVQKLRGGTYSFYSNFTPLWGASVKPVLVIYSYAVYKGKAL